MTRQQTTSTSRTRRIQGAHAGLSLDQILEAAARLDPARLTMLSVAQSLGVDRKALNHHVRDRDTLMGLLAWRAFAAHFSDDLTVDEDWRSACRRFAAGCVDSAIAVGPLAEHLTVRGGSLTRFTQQIDVLIGRMLTAGFDDEQALRSVTLLTSICLAFARDTVAASSTEERPRRQLVRAALDDATAPTLPNLTRILAEDIDTYGREQFEHNVEVFLQGTANLLANTNNPA